MIKKLDDSLTGLVPPDSFLDGYHKTTQVADIMNEGLKRNTAEVLRDRTMIALCHYGLLRGEDARGIQPPDVQHLPLEHREGPTACDIMVVLLLDGKTNQHGNTQYMGAIRNKNWDECPLGAMAMWLFYRSAPPSVIQCSRHGLLLSPHHSIDFS